MHVGNRVKVKKGEGTKFFKAGDEGVIYSITMANSIQVQFDSPCHYDDGLWYCNKEELEVLFPLQHLVNSKLHQEPVDIVIALRNCAKQYGCANEEAALLMHAAEVIQLLRATLEEELK